MQENKVKHMAMVEKSGLIFAYDTSIKVRSGQSGFKDLQMSPGFFYFSSKEPMGKSFLPLSSSPLPPADSLILDIFFHI